MSTGVSTAAGVSYRTVHTAELDPTRLGEIRALLDRAFDGDFGDADWEHCLGGVHALAEHAGAVVGHGAVVQRRLVTAGRALRTGYVEGVAVHPAWRGRGIGGGLMARLERVVGLAYDLGALATSEEGRRLYAGRGWVPWRGPLAAMTPTGPVPTPEDAGGVYVRPSAAAPDLDAELLCDWRDGDLW